MATCVSCKNYLPEYIDEETAYGECSLDAEIIALLPINWYWCPRDRSMPNAFEETNCQRWEQSILSSAEQSLITTVIGN
jgi:hypothetical protein